MSRPVGILTLQGDYDLHRRVFAALGQQTVGVRRPDELAGIGSLVIPGGESTTLTRLIDRVGLREPLRKFAAARPVMGTCAGLILLAAELQDETPADFGVETLGLLDCRVQRNGYGRQLDSFTAPLSIRELTRDQQPFPAVFIRAPRIRAVGPRAKAVAWYRDEPVAVRQGHLLGMTFHPELTADHRIHAAFLALD